MPTGGRAPPVKALKASPSLPHPAPLSCTLTGLLQTERSHEENQERAYIAASRRADRSLEARVQSARMASEIHRRRTGRGLKVTEEIVVKEEMYEEEEDDLPRQYKYLTAHLQTNSPAMNNRVNAYITTQAAMATMARYNEVNRLFSESFPSATAYQQQLSQSMYMNPLMNNGDNQFPSSASPSQAVSPTLTNEAYQGLDRRASTATAKGSPPSGTSISSPPALSPASGTTSSPELRGTPYQTPAQAFPNIDPQLQQQTSAFTSELPNEVKMMANIDMSDPMASHFLGGNPSAFQLFGQHPNDQLKLDTNHVTSPYSDVTSMPPSADPSHDSALFSPSSGFTSPFDAQFDGTFDFNRMGTPGAGGNEGAWESFVDFGSEQ